MEPVLRMHAGWRDTQHDEVDDRFFSQLQLVNAKRLERATVYSRTWEHSRPYLSEELLLYALLQSLAQRATCSSALSNLYMGIADRTAPGAIFGLSRDGFFTMVEHIARNSSNPISLSTMPGEDVMLTVTGDVADACSRGDMNSIDQQFFESAV